MQSGRSVGELDRQDPSALRPLAEVNRDSKEKSMKNMWTRALGSVTLAMVALAWGIFPAGAQTKTKQPMPSGAAAPAVKMRGMSNAERKAAAQAMAAKRTAAQPRNTAPPTGAGYQNTGNAVNPSDPARQNSRSTVPPGTTRLQNPRVAGETR